MSQASSASCSVKPIIAFGGMMLFVYRRQQSKLLAAKRKKKKKTKAIEFTGMSCHVFETELRVF